jgi:hypothetical protein
MANVLELPPVDDLEELENQSNGTNTMQGAYMPGYLKKQQDLATPYNRPAKSRGNLFSSDLAIGDKLASYSRH